MKWKLNDLVIGIVTDTGWRPYWDWCYKAEPSARYPGGYQLPARISLEAHFLWLHFAFVLCHRKGN